MATGACGINCDVCKLNLRGICSTCGSGKSDEGARKEAAQIRLLGAPCPILACARLNNIDYCMRDCRQFPCENFESGPYPFSNGYLQMQIRRRKEGLPAQSPSGGTFPVPNDFWNDLQQIPLETLQETAGAAADPPGGIMLPFLNETLRVDREARSLQKRIDKKWEPVDAPLLELMVVVYLVNATYSGIRGELVSEKDLKEAHFFQGPHALRTDRLLRRFGDDPNGLKEAARRLDGLFLDMGDLSFTLQVFPKIPISYVLWVGDEEFPPSLSILFDRSIENHLSADAIWGVVRLVSDALLNAS